MKLTPIKNLPKKYKATKNLSILTEFANSEYTAARVDDFANCDAFSCASCLNSSIKRFHMTGIKAISRRGQVFLIKL